MAAYQLEYRAMMASLTAEEYVAMQEEKRKGRVGGKSKEEIAAYRKAYYEKNRVHYGVNSCLTTGCNSVEQIVIMRDQT